MNLCLNGLTFSPLLGGDGDVERFVRASAAAGWPAIGLDTASIEAYIGQDRNVGDLRALLDERGLLCTELMPVELRADRAATSLEHTATICRTAGDLGADHVLTMVGGEVASGVDDALVSLARDAGRVAADRGVRLHVEFIPETPVSSIGECVRLIERVGSPDVRMLLDTWHFFRGPSTWADLDTFPLELLGSVQFDDAVDPIGEDLMLETVTRRRIPGEGVFALGEFAERLRSRGWEGTVSVELLGDDLRDLGPEEFARRARAATTPYWPAD